MEGELETDSHEIKESIMTLDERKGVTPQIKEQVTPKRKTQQEHDDEGMAITEVNLSERRSVRKRKVNPHVEAFLKGRTIKLEDDDADQESVGELLECGGNTVATEKATPKDQANLKRKSADHLDSDVNVDETPKRSKRIKTTVNDDNISTTKQNAKTNKSEDISSMNILDSSDAEHTRPMTARKPQCLKKTANNSDAENENNAEDVTKTFSAATINSATIPEDQQERDLITPPKSGHAKAKDKSQVVNKAKEALGASKRSEPKGNTIPLSRIEEILNAEPNISKSQPTQTDDNPKFNVVFDEESGNYQLTMSLDVKSPTKHLANMSDQSHNVEPKVGLLSKVDEELRDDSRTVYSCPVCHKQFVALPKFNKHVVGTNCTNIMLKGVVKVPEDIKPFIEKAGKVGDTSECPSCNKKLYCIEARITYVLLKLWQYRVAS